MINYEPVESLGDRLKKLERVEAARGGSNFPLMCRLDGRSFHTFTKGLPRPFDQRLSDLMVDTTKYLVEQTGANVGYTQSDEITLFWKLTGNESEHFFGGKYQKIVSVTAGMASGFFNKHLAERIPEKAHMLPVFDSRCWTLTEDRDIFLNFLWRQEDAIKNSISMLAQTYFSHKDLLNKNSDVKKQMMIDYGRPWDNEPEFFRSGSFVKRVVREVKLTEEQLSKIPEQHRPTEPVFRSTVETFSPGILKNITIKEWEEIIGKSDTGTETR